MTNSVQETSPCPAAWDTATPCANTDGDGHAGYCSDDNGNEWTRESSWFTPEARRAAEEDLEWL